MLKYSRQTCLKRYNLLTVTPQKIRNPEIRFTSGQVSRLELSHQIQPTAYSTTNILTAATWIYTFGAGITAAAGTRLALQLILVGFFTPYSFQPIYWSKPLLYLVATSLFQDWVIFAPAALLGCSSHISSSFSGIKPLSPVTRNNHGRPRSYHRQLIGQKFIWKEKNISSKLSTTLSPIIVFLLSFTSSSAMIKVLKNKCTRISPRFPTVIRVYPAIK